MPESAVLRAAETSTVGREVIQFESSV